VENVGQKIMQQTKMVQQHLPVLWEMMFDKAWSTAITVTITNKYTDI
jgi:hypothetical protein